ncbi:MAG: BatA and WFA domain-containing protein [Planctomycetia bacterium]|nr:BatA and WFA domain-containing protein [Planctomycetia bacterium]
MTFMNPYAWWFLLSIPLIVLAFCIRSVVRQERLATSIFWMEVQAERQVRVLFHRFRYPLSLLLCLLIGLLLIIAMTDPVTEADRRNLRPMVVIFDNSASMNTSEYGGTVRNGIREKGVTRFDLARKKLLQLIAQKRENCPVAILTMGGQAGLVTGFTDHPGTLRRMAETIRPTNAPDAFPQAVDLAEFLATSISRSGISDGKSLTADDRTVMFHEAEIVVITDGCLSDPTSDSPMSGTGTSDRSETEGNGNGISDRFRLSFLTVGTPGDNLAITRFETRRLMTGPTGYETIVELSNFSDQSIECEVETDLDGVLVDIIPFEVPPMETVSHIVRGDSASGGRLRAILRCDRAGERGFVDALADDNRAWCILPGNRPLKILYAGSESYFLSHVIAAQQNVEIVHTETIPRTVPDDSLLVLYQDIPEEIPSGNVLVVHPQSSCSLFTVGEQMETTVVGHVDGDSPIFRMTDFENLSVSGIREIRLTEEMASESGVSIRIDAKTPDEIPVSVDVELRADKSDNDGTIAWRGRLILLNSDISDGSMVLRTSFPILFSNIFNEFRETSTPSGMSFSTGETSEIHPGVRESLSGTVKIRMDECVDTALLQSETEESRFQFTREAIVTDGVVYPGMFLFCGVMEITGPDGEELPLKYIACNLRSKSESNLRSVDQRLSGALYQRSGWSVPPICRTVSVAAMFLLLLEWYFCQRRITV